MCSDDIDRSFWLHHGQPVAADGSTHPTIRRYPLRYHALGTNCGGSEKRRKTSLTPRDWRARFRDTIQPQRQKSKGAQGVSSRRPLAVPAREVNGAGAQHDGQRESPPRRRHGLPAAENVSAAEQGDSSPAGQARSGRGAQGAVSSVDDEGRRRQCRGAGSLATADDVGAGLGGFVLRCGKPVGDIRQQGAPPLFVVCSAVFYSTQRVVFELPRCARLYTSTAHYCFPAITLQVPTRA